MTYDIREQPVGLSPMQLEVYETVISHQHRFFFGPTREQIKKTMRSKRERLHIEYLDRALGTLIWRGYLTKGLDGLYVPKPPPHGTVLNEVCGLQQVSLKKLRSEDKAPRLVRARHLVSKRLREEFHYTYQAISQVLMRSHTVVGEYSRPDRRAQRSRQRAERYRKAAAAKRELRAAA